MSSHLAAQPSFARRCVRLLVLISLMLAFGTPAIAVDGQIEMAPDLSDCAPVTDGTRTCEVAPGTEFDVVFRLDAEQVVNGYDLEVRWDASELTLVSNAPLYSDTGTVVQFLESPSDPTDSSAVAVSVVGQPTTALFQMRFLAGSPLAPDGPDLWWYANGNGLAPGSLVLTNPLGAALDLEPTVTVVPVPGASAPLLVAVLLVSAVGYLRSR